MLSRLDVQPPERTLQTSQSKLSDYRISSHPGFIVESLRKHKYPITSSNLRPKSRCRKSASTSGFR